MEIRIIDNSVQLEGYINVTERKSKVLSDNKGNFIEIIKQGAFERALKRNNNILLLLDHDFSRQIGENGNNLELREDNIGLHYKATITDEETVKLAKENKLNGCSFGFKNPIESRCKGEALDTREIQDLDLIEVSILSNRKIPAYSGCSVEIRGLDNENIRLELRSIEDYETEELRTMNKAKALKEKKNDLLEKIEKIEGQSEELRTINEEIKKIDSEIDEITKKTEINSDAAQEFRSIKDAIKPNEKIQKRSYKDNINYDLGKLVKGLCGYGWKGADNENKYVRDMNTGNNTTIIPTQLSDMIYDYARNTSAIMGQIPTVMMEHGNMTIATQTKDIEAGFVAEGDLIPLTDVAFKPVELRGKVLAGIIPITEQLLQTSNISEILMSSIAKAITSQLDKALLYGAGENEQIKGISLYSDINKLEVEKIDYDALIKGIQLSKKANITPTHITYSTNTGTELALLKNSNGDYITKPSVLNNYIISESNNVKDNESYVIDTNSLILGLQKDITIEVGINSDDFRRLKKSIRIYINADLGVLNQKGITQIKING
ncbi:phage major capsid protein [uncultured Clostridium sp.]|uniref:phage major capsid protein n=1 Tax=uncultured Clostridium sp. TaxID=59620 RepID=UPI0025F9486A|nr:phage major capsid protein [uncultured Clostridium sp.]